MTISNPRLSFVKARFARLNEDELFIGERLARHALPVAQIDPSTAAFPSAGSIAFTGFNVDNPDSIAFVALEAVAAGSVIFLTDNGWNGTAFGTTEGTLTLTLAAGLAAGTVVVISDANLATVSTSHGTISRAGSFDLSGSTEALYAYAGSAATPTFLSAVANEGFTGANLLTGTTLTNGVNAIDLGGTGGDPGADIGAFTGARNNQSSFAAYGAIINNVANWALQDGGGSQAGDGTPPDLPFDPTAFTLGAATPSLTINDVTMAEGDSGTVTFIFTVSLSAPAGPGGVTFDIATADGTAQDDNPASDDNDYVANILTSQTIPAGSSTYAFSVTVNSDDLPETNETFFVNVTNVTGATVTDGQGQGTITNDDAAGALSIGDVGQAEGNAGSIAFTFTVTRAGGDDGAVGADWTFTLPGGAGGADASDFAVGQPLTGTVSFADGETSKTITLQVDGDVTFEPDETFTIDLSNPLGGVTIADGTATGTIQNDDAAPAGTLSVGDISGVEGDSGATTFTFTVLRSGGSAGAVTADWAISAPGGAGNADPNDFVLGALFTGQVSFADGETSKTITIDVEGDTVFEADENFTVTLSNATGGASIGDGSATGTILNDDPAPISVSIADASIVEGDGGSVVLQLTVTRSGGTGAFAVDFATSDGGILNHASATAGSDYVANSGALNFAMGQNMAIVSITINPDNIDELSEELTVTLSNATNGATIADGVAIGTIVTDDTGTAGPSGVWLNEFHYDNVGTDTGEFVEIAGVAGTSLAGYSIVLYNGNGGVTYDTDALTGTIPNQAGGYGAVHIAYPANGVQNGPDAIALIGPGNTVIEFISYGGTVTATNGPASGMTSVDVGVAEGATTPVGSSIGRLGGPGSPWMLFSDDTPGQLNGGQELGPTPHVSIADVSVNEAAGTMTFTVVRNNVAPGAFSVNYATANGTAIAGSDYVATSGTLNFADNQTQATVTVTLNDDGAAEFDETLFLNLSNVTGGAVLDDNQAVGTIVNDDGTPITVSINDIIQAEGTSGTTSFVFTVTRSGGTGAFSVNFATADGTATVADNDYVANSGVLNFGVGEMSKTISVTVNGNATPEGVENFLVNLSNATNDAILTDASGTGTILDGAGTFSFIHDIQGAAYFSPILAGEGISVLNVASAGFVTVQAIVTAVDNVGNRQGFYLQEQITDWDGNSYTSEGIFVMTRNDAGVGTAVSGVAAGDLVTVTAKVMEYQGFSTNMPITALVNPSAMVVNSTGNTLPAFFLSASHPIPNSIMTTVTPDHTDSADGAGDSFDAALFGISYWETVEGMLVTVPDMVVADGFVDTSGGRPFLQAYSAVHADADQINSRGGYTIAGDPPNSPPDTADPDDGTNNGGQILHDGDVNPDLIELDWTGWAAAPPSGLTANATMGDQLGDVTGIIDFDFTDRKLFVTAMEPGGFVDGTPVQETTSLGDDGRSLTIATFNVENLDPGDGAARFTALANAIANNLNAPDIISIEEMQDNNGAAGGDGTDANGTNAANSWQMLVNALNAATGAHYQWVDELPIYNSEGGEQSGNIRVGFLYNTDRVQLGNLDANATIEQRRAYTDRIGDGVRDGGDLIAFSDNMLAGEINTADWTNTRRSLLGEFTFNGNKVYVTANHFPSKGGSGSFWQYNQNTATGDPENRDWEQRSAVANDVYAMMNLIQQANADAGIVAGGDFNDFYFYRPLEVLTGYVLPDGSVRSGGARFDNLTLTLSEAERYTYAFDGRSQAIDHIVASQMLSGVATYDVVHLNTGYNENGTSPALSDHDPGLASFDYRNFAETLAGTAAADTILGFGGSDTISGGEGDDLLVGGLGDDDLSGGGGADTLYGEGGNDITRGGTGDDVYIVDATGDVVIEAIGEGSDSVLTQVSFILTSGADVELLSTTVHGATGAIELTGNYGNQTIYGNFGNNVITGGVGADVLIGLAGNDLYIVHDGAASVLEDAAGGNDIVFASVSFALAGATSVETLSSTFHGGTSALNLTGSSTAQTIFGNFGTNVLDGKGGADILVGFAGADTFAFTSALGGGNIDIIDDFLSGTDKIALDDAVFSALSAGSLPAGAFVIGTAAGDADDRIIYNSATGALFYDADGNGAGAAVQFATLNGHPVLAASDFQVI